MSAMMKKLRMLGDTAKDAADMDLDDYLGLIGLARRRSVLGTLLPAMGMLVLGGAIGAGIGLMFAPASGRRMRQNVEDRVNHLRDKFRPQSENPPNGIGTSQMP